MGNYNTTIIITRTYIPLNALKVRVYMRLVSFYILIVFVSNGFSPNSVNFFDTRIFRLLPRVGTRYCGIYLLGNIPHTQ